MNEDKILKNCNFCRQVEELNNEEIPYWSKKSENYSPYPKMVTCEEKYSLKNEDLIEVKPDLNESSLELKLSFDKDNQKKWIYYWAPNESEDILSINSPEKAYGNYENHGLKQCDDNGDVNLHLNYPQPYKDDKQTYCRHLHYILEGPDKTWLPLKTIRILCTIDIKELDQRIKLKDTILINDL